AKDVFTFLDSVRHPEGGFANGAPTDEPRAQNPHMHLFEALLNFEPVEGFPRAPSEREALRQLFRDTFWSREENALLEFFTEDLKPDPDKGCEVMPGHMPEWVWLLDRAGGEDASFLETMLRRGRELGMADGLPFLATTGDLRTNIRGSGYRLWAQCEHVRGCLVAARRLHDEQWLDEAAHILQAMRNHFFGRGVVDGGWHDALDEKGRVLSDRMPTSTLYHVVMLAQEVAATEHGHHRV
ncbi:MAG: AGE family epimerase/isomerase, partial [Parvularcula sp.]|nr:AGE family epimerase/isomerase [Parvularcula sp.]